MDLSAIKAPKFADLYKEGTPDPLLDVDGGNPWSPVWICGMEFGTAGCGSSPGDRIERFRRVVGREYDITAATNFSIDTDIFSVRSAALVACLTDPDFAGELDEVRGSNRKKRDFALGWLRRHRTLCTGGHGFRMNAGVFPLATHSGAFEKDQALRDFCGGASQAEYEACSSEIHAAHVEKRLRTFRPELVVCCGFQGWKNSGKIFREIFLTEALRPRLEEVSDPAERDHLQFERWKLDETGTTVVLTGFTGRRGFLDWQNVPILASRLRERIPRLKELDPVPASPFELDDADLGRCSPDQSDQVAYGEFLDSPEVRNWLARPDVAKAAETEFKSMITTVRPWDAKAFSLEDDQRGARYWLALLGLLSEAPRNKAAIDALAGIVEKARTA